MNECKPLLTGLCGVGGEPYEPYEGADLIRGRAVQVDPMKPIFKPPETKRLKVKYDVLLSTSAFKFNLRRYTTARPMECVAMRPPSPRAAPR